MASFGMKNSSDSQGRFSVAILLRPSWKPDRVSPRPRHGDEMVIRTERHSGSRMVQGECFAPVTIESR
jgi:hypothetical protein